MKKLLFTMLALLLMVGGAYAQNTNGDDDDDSDNGSSQTSFPDVPEGSYAADAVAELADLGIVIGFPDGTFRGNEAFTRYQAALVVTRLIDVLESQFVTEDDLASLRNAVQEIASDIAALEAAISSGTGMDPEAMQDLQNQLEELRTALDTLQALEARVSQNTRSIDALNDLVALLNEEIVNLSVDGDIDPSFLEDIQRNTDDIANIREFVILLRRDQVALRDQLAVLEESDAQQNERLSGLEERVTTLEDQSITFSGSIGLEYEVGRLSGDTICPVPLVDTDPTDAENPTCATENDDGTFEAVDEVIPAFDVDRIFGIGQEREVNPSIFSSGTEDENDDGDANDDGEEAEDREDITEESGDVDPTFEISFGFSSERGIRGLFNDFEASATLELQEASVLEGDIDPDGDADEDDVLNVNDPDEYFNGYVFSFNEFDATFSPIGAEPLTFTFGEEPDADFTPYVFESLGPGFVARVGTPDVLAFLQPELTIAYGAFAEGGDDDDETIELPDDDFFADGTPNPFSEAYYRAIRGTLSPFEGISGGFSVAQMSGNADEEGNAEGDNVNINVYGLDGEVNLSIVTITGEFATNQISDDVIFQDGDEEEDANVDDDPEVEEGLPVASDEDVDDSNLYYAQLEVDTADIPLLETLEANYRSIPQLWYGLKYDDDDYVYDLDQTGFGAKAGIGIFIFNLDVYADYYSIAESVDEFAEDGDYTENVIGDDGEPEVDEDTGENVTQTGIVTGDEVFVYGVEVGVDVYRAIEPFGFFSQAALRSEATDNFVLVEELDDAERDDSGYLTGIGAGLRHDGDADNALVPGLNFEIAYDFTESDLIGSGLSGSADTELTFFGFTVDPYFEYSSSVSASEFSDDEETFEVGTGLSSEPLDIFLQPSLVGNVNYRSTEHTDVGVDNDDDDDTPLVAAPDYTSTELQFSAGVALNQFLFENSVLNVRYGYYQGVNIQDELNSSGEDDTATDISDGDENNDLTQTTRGLEVGWVYYGLEFGYGYYSNERGEDVNVYGQSFSIAYELEF